MSPPAWTTSSPPSAKTWHGSSHRSGRPSMRVWPAGLANARPTGAPVSSEAVTSFDVRMVVERITSDVLAALGEFVTPPGYAHLSLALVDAVYSIRSRYPAVKRVVAAYCEASHTGCRAFTAQTEPGFREHGLDYLLDQAGTEHGVALADRLFGGSRSRTAGRLKADVCVEAAMRLQAVSVTDIPDLGKRADDAEVPSCLDRSSRPGVGHLAVLLFPGRHRPLQARCHAHALCRRNTRAICQPARDRRTAVACLRRTPAISSRADQARAGPYHLAVRTRPVGSKGVGRPAAISKRTPCRGPAGSAADRGVDVVEKQVLHVHVGRLGPGVAGSQDLVGRGRQGPHPPPQSIARDELGRGKPFIRDVAGGPQPHLPVVARSFDLPLSARCRRRWLGTWSARTKVAGSAGPACRQGHVPGGWQVPQR